MISVHNPRHAPLMEGSDKQEYAKHLSVAMNPTEQVSK
jgi:hypothetical protein